MRPGISNVTDRRRATNKSPGFPEDFMFQLTPSEKSELVANCDHLSRLKFAKALSYAFTEHAAPAMSILNEDDRIDA